MNNMHETRSERPESLWLARRMWLAAVAMEAVHQLLGVVRAFVDPSDIRSEMRQYYPSMPQDTLDFFISMSSVIALVFALSLLGIVVWLAVSWRLRLLVFFGSYVALRGGLVFFEEQQGWLFLINGAVQIVVAVFAVLAIIFGARKDSIEWMSR